jgi:4a-hydroxytetrahydrobiopterin dehydratase
MRTSRLYEQRPPGERNSTPAPRAPWRRLGMLGTAMALLSDAQIEQHLEGGDWRREDATIVRDLTFADFAGAIAFVNRVAETAEAANHHPDILVHGWKHVRLTLSTHSQGGLTDSDFALASQIDALA